MNRRRRFVIVQGFADAQFTPFNPDEFKVPSKVTIEHQVYNVDPDCIHFCAWNGMHAGAANRPPQNTQVAVWAGKTARESRLEGFDATQTENNPDGRSDF